MNSTEDDINRRPKSVLWRVFGQRVPRSEIVYFCQMLLIYIVVITSLVNLSRGRGPDNVWLTFLGTCLGYVLPSPRIKKTQQ